MPVVRNFNSYFDAVQKTGVNWKKDKDNKKFSHEIENLFRPVLKDGKFSVVMRFLPGHPDEGVPFVENRTHMHQLSNGSWIGCDCLNKFQDAPVHKGSDGMDYKCPFCEYNSRIYKKYGRTDEAREKALKKWKPKFYSNVLIVRNPNAPETEGKVFRFEYGSQIMKFISDAMEDKKDELEGTVTPGINPFSWFGPNDAEVMSGQEKAGANFVFEGFNQGGYTKYDNSHFSAPRRICKVVNGQLIELDNAQIDEVEKSLFTLSDIEKKLSDCRTYEQVVESFKKKSGHDMFEEFEDGFKAAPAANPYSAANKTWDVVTESDDGDMFATPKSAPAASESSPLDDAEDNDSFFARLSGN